MSNFSFANMSPAERLKASGLIGLIVILVFFVVYTMLGAISPKKPASALSAAAALAGVPSPPPATPGDPVPTASGPSFPTDKLVSSKGRGLANSLSMDIPDPFVPIAHPKESSPAAPAAPAKKPEEPKIEVHPISPADNHMQPVADVRPLDPGLGGTPGGPLPGLPAGPAAVNPLPGAPAPVAMPAEPEIRVIGIVHGEDSIATLEVAGRIILARPGDALAKGYRLVAVSPEGIMVRHLGQVISLRVGSSLNEKTDSK